ncbi:spindle pole body component 110-like [Spodoptera litura]|uniref:Spindle pole body component 110-like n=1 Tax=Spodoptera litura TaxID=69820 RepID=A0A9J7ELM8_SPOLT|nr:spindle pole body component 110-like [Spodoptera litura]
MPQSEYWPFNKGKTAENVEYSDEAAILQKQLGDMEGEVKSIQMELAAIKRDRMDLYARNPSTGVISDTEEVLKIEQQQTDLLEDDSTLKYPEIAKLREELIKAKNLADEERFQREKYESKLKDLELKLNNICCAGMITEIKETKKSSDEEMTVLKTQVRDMREETEELKITLVEKSEQLQEYRIKYLQAQQRVEELKRQLDVIEFDNKQVSDQIQIEIQKMKMQFQEKLQELAPLPDLLKGAQIQLQEAKQLQRLAEDSSEQLSNELLRVKEKLVIAVNNLNQEKVERSKLLDENKFLRAALEDKNKEIDEVTKMCDDYKCKALRIEEKLTQHEIRYKEKATECSQLLKDLEESRIENSRSLGRCKERADSMRRYLQTQISELERQLIQSRAHCRACQKERDEIRQRMQIQINNLQENFELVEIRLRALQNQVTSLKNSYTVILADNEEITEINKINTT